MSQQAVKRETRRKTTDFDAPLLRRLLPPAEVRQYNCRTNGKPDGYLVAAPKKR